MQSVLAELQSVQATVQGASKADLIKMYASYDAYVAKLNNCINQLNAAIGGVQQQTIEAGGTVSDPQAEIPGAQQQIEALRQAGQQLRKWCKTAARRSFEAYAAAAVGRTVKSRCGRPADRSRGTERRCKRSF